ncbi:hypothetical protein LF817_16020 [Halobacillus sp. A1]|uniref:hypothetical protein n=1 Tax=Halobacillus sp. A1 TaxID=2880262 RepID=UPI0020A6A1CD|nr:hypothetical protein [Halobacillus sp. A1]MCP3032833.1 hypothetical protein [Halobacillus sp. A1]
MKKAAKYISNSFLVIAVLLFLVGLFTDFTYAWLYPWLFLAPSLVIQEILQMPAKGKRRIYSFVYISVVSIMFGIAVLELITG